MSSLGGQLARDVIVAQVCEPAAAIAASRLSWHSISMALSSRRLSASFVAQDPRSELVRPPGWDQAFGDACRATAMLVDGDVVTGAVPVSGGLLHGGKGAIGSSIGPVGEVLDS